MSIIIWVLVIQHDGLYPHPPIEIKFKSEQHCEQIKSSVVQKDYYTKIECIPRKDR